MPLADLKGRLESEKRTERLQVTVSPTVAEKLRILAQKYQVSHAAIISELVMEAK